MATGQYAGPAAAHGAGTGAAAGATVPGGVRPSAAEIAARQSPENRHEVYTIKATDTVEECFAYLTINSGLIYCCGGETGGVLAAASGTTYIGRTRKFLTELRAVGEENTPVLINETALSDRQSARTYVRGTQGDTILLIYRP
jgi:hypothetical protein